MCIRQAWSITRTRSTFWKMSTVWTCQKWVQSILDVKLIKSHIQMNSWRKNDIESYQNWWRCQAECRNWKWLFGCSFIYWGECFAPPPPLSFLKGECHKLRSRLASRAKIGQAATSKRISRLESIPPFPNRPPLPSRRLLASRRAVSKPPAVAQLVALPFQNERGGGGAKHSP